jgi:hypothetical protein
VPRPQASSDTRHGDEGQRTSGSRFNASRKRANFTKDEATSSADARQTVVPFSQNRNAVSEHSLISSGQWDVRQLTKEYPAVLWVVLSGQIRGHQKRTPKTKNPRKQGFPRVQENW